jgi:hypothetical protein
MKGVRPDELGSLRWEIQALGSRWNIVDFEAPEGFSGNLGSV